MRLEPLRALTRWGSYARIYRLSIARAFHLKISHTVTHFHRSVPLRWPNIMGHFLFDNPLCWRGGKWMRLWQNAATSISFPCQRFLQKLCHKILWCKEESNQCFRINSQIPKHEYRWALISKDKLFKRSSVFRETPSLMWKIITAKYRINPILNYRIESKSYT